MSAAQLRRDARFRRLVDHVHGLGPRPCGEAMITVAQGRDLIEPLEQYANLDPAWIAALDGRHWPPVPLTIVGSTAT